MRVEVFHNETRDDEGRHAAWSRFGTEFKTQPGDELVRVGEFYFADLAEPSLAADRAFDAGNNPADSPLVRQYRSWKVRSLSVGDVVVAHMPERPSGTPQWASPMSLSCESSGWRVVDLDEFTVQRPSLTHEQGNGMLAVIVEEFGIESVAVELRWFASEHLSTQHGELEEIGSSDVSIHLAHLANHETVLLREEALRLRERQELVARISARTGKSQSDTLRDLQRLFEPAGE